WASFPKSGSRKESTTRSTGTGAMDTSERHAGAAGNDAVVGASKDAGKGPLPGAGALSGGGLGVLDEPGTQTRHARAWIRDDDLPRASVVVPVLDAVSDVDRLLASLEVLDYPRDRLEILVVDNGSRDGTVERVARRPAVRLLRETRVRS